MTPLQIAFTVIGFLLTIGVQLWLQSQSEQKAKREFEKQQGYVKRQLEDIEVDVKKSFDFHKVHFAHAEKSEIHQKSMDEKLIESKFERANEQIKALSHLITLRMDDLVRKVDALANSITNGRH